MYHEVIIAGRLGIQVLLMRGATNSLPMTSSYCILASLCVSISRQEIRVVGEGDVEMEVFSPYITPHGAVGGTFCYCRILRGQKSATRNFGR